MPGRSVPVSESMSPPDPERFSRIRIRCWVAKLVARLLDTPKLQEKTSALKREPTIFIFVGQFCPPGSGSGFWIRIHGPDWIRIQSGSAYKTLVRLVKIVSIRQNVTVAGKSGGGGGIRIRKQYNLYKYFIVWHFITVVLFTFETLSFLFSLLVKKFLSFAPFCGPDR